MTTIVTVETEGLPASKFKVESMPKKILITIDEKTGIVFEDVTNKNLEEVPKIGIFPMDIFLDQKTRINMAYMKAFRNYITPDQKVGESIATAVGPGGVRSKFEYYVTPKGEYYSVRLNAKRYNRYMLGRITDPESKISKIWEDVKQFPFDEPFIQTQLEKSETLPFEIRSNRTILKSALEILEFMRLVYRIKDEGKLSQKFARRNLDKELVVKS